MALQCDFALPSIKRGRLSFSQVLRKWNFNGNVLLGRSSDFLGTALRESWNEGCLGRGQNALAQPQR